MAQSEQNKVTEEVSDKILTIPNVISTIRLIMVPIAFYFLLKEQNVTAAVLFAVAAATDFLDGQIARRTHCVTKLGQLLDPAVDRCLMIFGVLGLLITGRLPLWIFLFVLIRDVYMLAGGAYLLKRWKVRVPVIYPGKFATTFLFVGFAALILNMPLIPGLGLVDAAWLPGLNGSLYCWGIWLVYAGLLLTIGTTVYYTVAALGKMQEARKAEREANGR